MRVIGSADLCLLCPVSASSYLALLERFFQRAVPLRMAFASTWTIALTWQSENRNGNRTLAVKKREGGRGDQANRDPEGDLPD